MEKTLVIYDPDIRYGERLMQYVNEKAERYGLCALAISQENVLLEYLKETTAELLLCEEGLAGRTDFSEGCRQLYRLSSAPPPEKDLFTVSKYQSVEQMMRKLLAGQLQEQRRMLQQRVLEKLDYSREVSDEELLKILEELLLEMRQATELTEAESKRPRSCNLSIE